MPRRTRGIMTKKEMTVVLDLDHTLVYTLPMMHDEQEDTDLDPSLRTHIVTVGPPADRERTLPYLVIERPGLSEFLCELSQWCEIVVFTAALAGYARPILRALDPERRYFTQVYSRKDTVILWPNTYVKDLTVLHRPLDRVLIVDDERDSFYFQPDNGLHIPKFTGDASDTALLSWALPEIRQRLLPKK